MKFTVCPTCLRTVSVRRDGMIGYHVGIQWSSKACAAYKTPARWTDGNKLIAAGKNTSGDCMRCGTNVSDGPDPDCPQCNLEVLHDDVRCLAAYKKDRQSRKK